MDSSPAATDSTLTQASQVLPSSDGSVDACVNDQLTEGIIIQIELFQDIPKVDRESVVRENVQIKKFLIQELG